MGGINLKILTLDFGPNYRYPLVRAFDLIRTLRARQEYQLSADIHSHNASTKLPYKWPLYLVWPRFISNNFFWLCAAVVSHSYPLSKWLRHIAIKRKKQTQKMPVFGLFRRYQWVKFATKYLKSDFYAIFIEHCFRAWLLSRHYL